MKVKTKKIMAVICLILTFFTALPLQTFAAFITDMNSNAEFGVINGSLATYKHELHYANYDGATYMLFCIEYGKTSPTGKAYVYGDEFIAQYKENRQEYKKIAEMIYFGYTMKHGMGIPGSYEAQRDACATQQYVWEQTGKAPGRDSWNGTYMSSSIYANWLSEAEANYNQYHSRVSFDGENRAISIGETTTFSDGNGALAHFDSFNTTINGVNFAHDNGNNDLRVTATNEANGTVTFNSREHGICELMPNGAKYTSDTMSNYVYFQFSSGSVQNLMFSSYVDPTVFNLSVEIQSGSVQIQKYNNMGNPVANCTFDLYADEGCSQRLGTSTSDTNGQLVFDKLRPGTYWVKETSVPAGYLQDTSVKRVDVVNGQTATVEFKNNEPTGKIFVYKVSDNNDKVAGAVFSVRAEEDIKNAAGTKTFYTKGQEVIQIISAEGTGIAETPELPLGSYSVREVQAPKGYLLNENVYQANLVYQNSTTPVVEIKIEGIKNTEPTGKIIIHKVSEYDDKLTGAVFSVKADEEITNVAKTKTFYHKGQEIAKITTTNGVAEIDELPMGKYTIKEVQAPKGYLLNEKTFTVELKYKDQKTPVIEIEIDGIVDNEPRGNIGIVKKDSKTGSKAQGDATLKDAVYNVYANEDIYNVAKSKKFYSKGDLVATRNTNENGDCEDITGLPLGKYLVKEEKAPVGYMIDKKEYEVNLTYKDQYTKVITGNAQSTDKVKEMRIHLFKSGIKVNSGKTPGLAGAVFTIKLNSSVEKAYAQGYNYEEVWGGIDEFGNKVEVDSKRVAEAQVIAPTYETLETDENGDAYSGLLPYGTYIAKETTTPKDYESASDFTFSISEDESEIEDIAKKVKDIVVNNEQLETYIKLIKQDLKTGKKVSLNNATFQIKATKDIYDRATGKILYKKGEAVSQKIGSTTYNSFTTNAKSIVIPDKSYTNDKEELGTIITPLKLEVGTYEITEIKVPEGFLQLDEPVAFKVDGIKNYDKDQDGDFIKEVVVKNEQPTGTLIIDKSVALRDEVDTSIVDISDLSGIEFELTAKDDIIDYADGSVIYKKGQKVNIYKLDKNGDLNVTNLPMGIYELQEVKTIDGLVLNNKKYEVKFMQQDLVTKVYEVKEDISNDTTVFEFSKTDITGDVELEGAKLTVLDEKENIIDTWISSDKTHKIEGLVVGKTYTLKEEIAPNNYVKSTDIQFEVKNTKEVQKVEMIDKIVEMYKKNVGGEEVEGAKIQVFDKDGNVIDEWISSKEPHRINNLVENETYTLHEEIAPDGYVVANDIDFTVTEDKETQIEEMIDKILEITKADIAGNEIEGATLQVIDKDGNIVDEWVSTKAPHKVNGLKENETYTLHEEVAVDGYVKASNMEFKVTDKKETQKEIMIDKIVEITKTDLVTGEEIEGAELQVIDENGNVVDEWTSTKEPHKVTGLEEGKKYKLVEITAPYGYEMAEEIEFTVSFEKETQKCIMKDMPILKDIKLIKVDSKTKEIIKLDFSFGIYEDEACTKLIKEVHSDKENGTVLFEDLRYGTYYIKEIQSPNDYIKSDRAVKVEINDKGVFVDSNLVEENADGVYSFEFENEKIETPNTGDNSDIGLWLTLLATSSIAIAGLGIHEYKKRKLLKK